MILKKELKLKTIIAIFLMATTSSYQLSAMENSDEKSPECPICCNNYDDGEKMRVVTPCNHELCVDCSNRSIGQGYQYVDEWRSSERTYTCPFCRRKISTEEFKKMVADVPKECLQTLQEEPESLSHDAATIPHIPTIEYNFSPEQILGRTVRFPEARRVNRRPYSGLPSAPEGEINAYFANSENFVSEPIFLDNDERVTNRAAVQGLESPAPSPQKELHFGCMQGNLNRVRLALESVSNPYEIISASDETGNTALHWAVSGENKDIVLMLIANAEQEEGRVQHLLSSRTIYGQTPLEKAKLALLYKHNVTEIIRILESYNQ